MNLNRREFLLSSGAVSVGKFTGFQADPARTIRFSQVHESATAPQSFAVIPVVGDGKWIWRDPPSDGQKGYLEPRLFEVEVGIHFRGNGNASRLRATTVAPVGFSEQEITDFRIETSGCNAAINQITDSAAQFVMAAPQIVKGQVVSAIARYRMNLKKDFRAFERDIFPIEQSFRVNKRRSLFAKEYYRSSPGINVRSKEIKSLLSKLNPVSNHAWDRAKLFHKWVWENIEGIPGRYTSVEQAIRDGKGDCEERAAVFIALCRASGIPARLVWVPSHNWAEIGLYDHDGNQHWIPVHTAAYSWFGWTGAHELVLQKGDRIRLVSRKSNVRLIDDWYSLKGTRPEMRFSCKLTPLAPTEGVDPGPGAREKLPDGRWQLTGDHSENGLMRDQ